MPDFFLTFGGATPNRDRFKRITAPDYMAARAVAFDNYGPKWAFLYDETQKADAIDRYGLTELEPALTAAVISEHTK